MSNDTKKDHDDRMQQKYSYFDKGSKPSARANPYKKFRFYVVMIDRVIRGLEKSLVGYPYPTCNPYNGELLVKLAAFDKLRKKKNYQELYSRSLEIRNLCEKKIAEAMENVARLNKYMGHIRGYTEMCGARRNLIFCKAYHKDLDGVKAIYTRNGTDFEMAKDYRVLDKDTACVLTQEKEWQITKISKLYKVRSSNE